MIYSYPKLLRRRPAAAGEGAGGKRGEEGGGVLLLSVDMCLFYSVNEGGIREITHMTLTLPLALRETALSARLACAGSPPSWPAVCCC